MHQSYVKKKEINERHVLKAPNSGNDMPPQMPPMGPDPMMGQDLPMGGPEMDDEIPDSDDGDDEGGVGSDVKKYSGELSQALNSYNEENPNDEEKLNKYAVNMIAAQVANYLSDKDKRAVIKKLKGDSDDMSSDEVPQPEPQMENRVVSEITNELMNDRRNIKRDEKYITNKEVTKNSPFVSNR